MKYLLLILSLVLGQTANAASGSGDVSSVVSVCGVPLSSALSLSGNKALTYPTGSLVDVVTLTGNIISSTAGHYYAFYSANSPASGAQTKYQVPGGKTFYVLSMNFWANSAGDTVLLGYGTAAIAAEDTGTAPTGEVVYSSTNVQYNLYAQTTSAYTNFQLPMSFPASSYPFFKSGQSSQQNSVILCGIVK